MFFGGGAVALRQWLADWSMTQVPLISALARVVRLHIQIVNNVKLLVYEGEQACRLWISAAAMRAAFEILWMIFAMLQSVVQDLPKENIKFINTKLNVDAI